MAPPRQTTKVVTTFCIIVTITSILNVLGGVLAIIGYVNNKESIGMTGLILSFVMITGGIVGIVSAALLAYQWLISVFAGVMALVAGLNAYGLVSLRDEWDMHWIRSRRQIEAVFYTQIAITIVDIIGLISALGLLWAVRRLESRRRRDAEFDAKRYSPVPPHPVDENNQLMHQAEVAI